MKEIENYKAIPEFEGLYEINEPGTVKSLLFGAAPQIKEYQYNGQRIVTLKNRRNKRKRIYVDRVLLELF